MIKNIIINADDLGLSDAVNQAIIQLALEKRINSTSFMSLGNINREAVDILTDSSVNIGLHLDFTEFSKAHLGKHFNLRNLIVMAWSRKLAPETIKQMISYQLDLFEEKMGCEPDFVDGHQHVHQFPIIRELLLEIMTTRYHHDFMIRSTKPQQDGMKSKVIHYLGGKSLDKKCQAAQIKQNKGFSGVYNFKVNDINLPMLWENWLRSASEGTLIMCHPAQKDALWKDEIKHSRELEYDWLMSDEFQELAEK